MKAKILKIERKPSRYGGWFYYAFFKGEDGRSYRSCIYPNCGNYARWRSVIENYKENEEVWLSNLVLRGKGLIDADSKFERS